MIVALNSEKIDGFMTTTLRVPFILRDNASLAAFELQGPFDQLAVMVARTDFGAELLPKINEFIASSRKSGLFQEMYDAWFHAQDGYPEIISPSELPQTNGVIRYAAQAGNEPISLMKGMDMVGFEMDILTHFCKEYGYGLEVTELNLPGMLAGISSGKYDLAGGGLAITEERRQSADFTDSYYSLGQWIVVRAAPVISAASAASGAPAPHPLDAFWQGLKTSVEKNFVREGRWRLIVSGIGVTLTISILSALFGTLFGFGVCMLRLRGRKAVSGAIKAFVRIIQGVPLVVLLMVLYYVVFGSVNINAILVAVIGLFVNFGVYVSEMMRTGIEAVDKGQIEAALALGYSRMRTFWKITFPQAARHFLPVYKGEFISMVKMTSIVGYIAIMDLTKASDIIRSRTYEAFFPLIVTAVIYFLLAWSLTSLLNLMEIRIDPKRRSRKLKGVIER
jgi:polar amino acid transport system substrate-binding protein